MTRKSKILSDERIKPPATSGNNLNWMLDCFNNPKLRLEFNGSCLETDSAVFNHKLMNFCITYERIMAVIYWKWFYVKKFFIWRF